jgi:phenylacetate-CoA ligase
LNGTANDALVLTVIAPCFNEQDNVEVLVLRTMAMFEELNIDAELLLIDDGSSDDTWARIQECAEGDDRVRGVRHERNGGIETAWRSGLSHARGQLVCLIDADLQNRPEDIERLYRTYLRELPDMVQAVRRPARGVTRCKFFSRGLNALLNISFGMKLRDNKSGFLLCRRDVLRRILKHRYSYRYFQSFVGVAAGAAGYTIAEVETSFEQRHAGASFLSRFPVLVSCRIIWEMLKFRHESNRMKHEATTTKSMPRTGVPVISEGTGMS